MKTILAAVVAAALVAVAGPAPGQEPGGPPQLGPMANQEAPAQAPGPLSLATVQWIGPGTTLEALKGKTVILLVYATWCPKCNQWSGEMFGQLKEAMADKPVVVVAVNADEHPTGRLDYVQERGFIGPGIFHGVDPMMHRRLGFDSNLFQYVLIGPDGQERGRGSAGAMFQGNDKRFVLTDVLHRAKDLGQFRILKPGLEEPVKLVLWPIELGMTVPDRVMKRAMGELTPQQREQYNAVVDEFCQHELDTIKGLYDKGVLGQIEAYERASALAANFPNTEQAKKARKGLLAMNADRQFKRELAARDYYQNRLAEETDPRQRQRLLQGMAKRFKGTHYGDLAASEVEGAEAP